MLILIADHDNDKASTTPRWVVLLGPVISQRFRLDDWAHGVVRHLVSTGAWIARQTGDQIDLRHVSMSN